MWQLLRNFCRLDNASWGYIFTFLLVFFVEVFFDMLGNLPFDFMLRKSFLGDSECFVYHIELHVDNLDPFLSGDEYFAHYYLYKFKLQSMSSSPYVPNDVKSYMRKYDVFIC